MEPRNARDKAPPDPFEEDAGPPSLAPALIILSGTAGFLLFVVFLILVLS
jgi:hypothetical protein